MAIIPVRPIDEISSFVTKRSVPLSEPGSFASAIRPCSQRD